MPTATSRLATGLFVVFEVLANVLMLNVLIAVVSDSYELAQSKARRIYLETQLEQAVVFDGLGFTAVRAPCFEWARGQLAKLQCLGSSSDSESNDAEEDAAEGDDAWEGRTAL